MTKTILFVFFLCIGFCLCKHAFVVNGEEETSSEAGTEERTWGDPVARATVPPEYVCNVGVNKANFFEYTNDREGTDRACNFTIIDINAQIFFGFEGRVIEFFDQQIPIKGHFGKKKTIQGARSISLFPALGVASSIVEAMYIDNGRTNFEQGQECAVGADTLQLAPWERNAADDVLSLDRSWSATDDLDVALSQSIFKTLSSDGKREFYTGQRLSYTQFEQKRLLDPNTGTKNAFTLTLIAYGEDQRPSQVLSGYCNAGVPYNSDDFYTEFPDGNVGLGGSKRDDPMQVYENLGSIPWGEIASAHSK